MSEQVHVRARKFLQEFFSDEELTTFSFDYFPQVYSNFTRGMTKNEMVLELVAHSQRRGRFDELLAALERERPKSYPNHFAEQPHLIDPEPQPQKAIERNPRQIFISHAHQDADFAQKLVADLRANGWQTWMAHDNIRPGEKWVEAINRGLAECGVFVLLLTPDAVASRWVKSEMNVAIGMEHREEMRLIPLNVEPAVTPALWRAYQWVAFIGDYDAGLTALLSELKSDKVSSTQPINIQLADRQGRQLELNKDADINSQEPLGKRIKKVPAYWFYSGGSVVLLLILLAIFWPDISPTVEPTKVAETSIATREEPASTTPTVSIPSRISSSIPTEHLLLYYPFDGNADDVSGNNEHGSVHGSVLTADRFGEENSAYYFDGKDDHIVSNYELFFKGSEYTVSLWFDPEKQSAEFARLFHRGSAGSCTYAPILSFASSNSPRVAIGPGCNNQQGITGLGNHILNLNEWHHFVLTVGPKEQNVYINGDLVSTDNHDAIITVSSKFFLGAQTGNGEQADCCYYLGAIDDVLVYDRVLLEDEIKSIFHEGGWTDS